MNPDHVSDLLERAAATVTPAEIDPAARLVRLGRRSVLRRRAWAAAGSVAAAVTAVVALPFAVTVPERWGTAESPGTTVSFGGVSVAVPKGWQTREVRNFNACTAQPRTVYLAAQWDFMPTREVPPGGGLIECASDGQAWMALVRKGVAPTVSPELLVVRDGRLLEVDRAEPLGVTSLWSYRPYAGEIEATAALMPGNDKDRERLLARVTWRADPPAPATGGLALPGRITNVTADQPPNNAMVVATDAETLEQIRTALAELRDPVPAGAECALRKPGSIGISLDSVTVVLGDETCPQAISTGGGRVRAPARLGRDLLTLVVASDRAATERPPGK